MTEKELLKEAEATLAFLTEVLLILWESGLSAKTEEDTCIIDESLKELEKYAKLSNNFHIRNRN